MKSKRKTGVVLDGYGNKIDKQSSNDKTSEPSDPNELMFQKKDNIVIEAKEKEYKKNRFIYTFW